jgi:hypothetical protein
MKPELQKIFTKLSEEKQKQIDDKLEKVELARKPESILADAKKIDDRVRQEEIKFEKKYLKYLSDWKEWQDFLNSQQHKAEMLILKDIKEVKAALSDLGIKPNSIPELNAAEEIAKRFSNISGFKSLYKSPQS